MSGHPASSASMPAAQGIADDELRCPACDYDLRVMLADRCPECGMVVDRASLSRSQIPWSYRGEMGWLRAYVRTAWLVFFRPRRIAADVARPVGLDDAQRFRRITVLFAFVPMFAMLVWGTVWLHPRRIFVTPGGVYTYPQDLAMARAPTTPPHQVLGWALEGLVVLAAGAALWLFLHLACGVAGYFFHPSELSITRQNRALALSRYACAPLAAMPLTAVAGACTVLVGSTRWSNGLQGFRAFALLDCLTFALLAVQVGAWWRCTVVMLRQTTRCGAGRTIALGIFLPIAWASLFALVFIGLTATAILIAIMLLSLA